jgi:hypothetical protein
MVRGEQKGRINFDPAFYFLMGRSRFACAPGPANYG